MFCIFILPSHVSTTVCRWRGQLRTVVALEFELFVYVEDSATVMWLFERNILLSGGAESAR